LVERARRFADYLLEAMENEKHVNRSRFDKRLRAMSLADPYFDHSKEKDPRYADSLEQKIEKKGKKLLLQRKDDEDSNDNDYETSGNASHKQ